MPHIKFRKKIKLFYFILSCLFVFCLAGQAGILDYYDSSDIAVIIGETVSLSVNNPKQVKIGNPLFLDVVSAGARELLLSGLAEGETILTVVDDFGKRNYAVKIYKEDLGKLKERVDILLEAAGFDTLQTRIGDKERKVFIVGSLPASKQGVFDSRMASVKDKIVNLVEFRDDILSVEIDVEVMEIEKTALDNLGLQWNKTITFSEGSTVPDRFQFDNLLNPTKTLKIMSDWRTSVFTATLNFLKSNNKARTLSRPKIVCLSGKEASLIVGGERPIIKGSTTTTSTTGGSTTDYEIELKEYGIKLSIKPTVKENNEIQVELKTDITEIDETQALQLSSVVSTPGLKKRSAQTELTVIDGQTVFLAGLIKSQREDNRDNIAGLGNIPLFGALFRHKDLSQTDTEIVITLTPTILGNRTSLQSVSAQTDAADAKNISANIDTEPQIIYSEDDPVVKYSRLVQNIINSNISYPKELEDKDYEGTVKISLHLLPTGELLGAVTIQSSGSQVLDEAAEKAVKKLAPFPGFPPQLQLKELWLDIPIVYRSQKT